MENEEEIILQKVKNMKRENELLMVIFEELDELISTGYNGPIKSEKTEGLIFSLQEYKKWRNGVE